MPKDMTSFSFVRPMVEDTGDEQSPKRPTTWRNRINNAPMESEVPTLGYGVVELQWVVWTGVSAPQIVECHDT